MLKSYYNAEAIEAGLDEVGRGCLAGPVVAAAVILPKDYTHPILNDSKQLSRRQRELLKKDIERDALTWAVAEVSHEDIDRINILKASFLAMHRVVDSLIIKPEHLLVDGNRFVPYPFQNNIKYLTPETMWKCLEGIIQNYKFARTWHGLIRFRFYIIIFFNYICCVTCGLNSNVCIPIFKNLYTQLI